MTISALLSPERIFINTAISSKKKLLEFIADQVSSHYQLTQSGLLYSNLLNRERLGSTGLGKGFAVPHARLPDLDTAIGLFIKLDKPINFDAPDNQPVDLVFTIIIPDHATDQHLQTLSALAKVFSQPQICEAIRNATSSDEVVNIIDSAEQ
ncbi:MAG: PTS IIA-like nitrogen regulatory protein PtsN [Gammaproteobacteria bacterium]|nr:PTS IIA-like nitrogen regulatory protein PtsN [Gammaproteobacteria bacterium]